MTQIKSSMPGSVQYFFCEDGDRVAAGAKLLSIECMKTMYELPSPVAGIVHYRVELGQVINRGTLVAEIE